MELAFAQLLGHVEVRPLQDALGDPERDPVDEKALPERERRRRRLLQAWEVRQVAAERLPALGFLPACARPATPGAAVEHERPEQSAALTNSRRRRRRAARRSTADRRCASRARRGRRASPPRARRGRPRRRAGALRSTGTSAGRPLAAHVLLERRNRASARGRPRSVAEAESPRCRRRARRRRPARPPAPTGAAPVPRRPRARGRTRLASQATPDRASRSSSARRGRRPGGRGRRASP